MTDPTVWGPILISISIFFAADMVCRKLAEHDNKMIDEMRRQLEGLTDAIERIERQVDSIESEVRSIENNTAPPGGDYD